MRNKNTTIVILLLLTACSKQNIDQQFSSTNEKKAITANEISVPLNDLGTGTYQDSVGGLYPGGLNNPSGQYAYDLTRVSKSIIPIDTFGNSSTKGNIVFISLGASTGGHNMKSLKLKTSGNTETNPYLKLLDCNNGSGDASLNSLMNANAPYWNHVTQILRGAKSSYRQVQVIYMETDDSSIFLGFPKRPSQVKTKIEASLRVFKQKFQNIKIVYVLGRTRTFNADARWNREPAPYYFGWACKWAIQDQINGVPGTEYKGNNAIAPMITWGFYQWADTMPRKTDGFFWKKSETADGLHANPIGQDTLSNRFQNFLLTDKRASIWYAAH